MLDPTPGQTQTQGRSPVTPAKKRWLPAFALPVIGRRLVNEITVANVDECRSGAPDVTKTDAGNPDQPRAISSAAMTVATLFHHHQCH
jgi:hypothetical protein